MARFGSWVIVEPKFVKNTKVESLISRSLGGTLKLTTRGRVGFYFSVQTSFDHNLAIQKHAIPNQNILSPFLGLFDPFFGQKWRKIIFSAISKGFVTCSWYEDVLVVLNSLMVCLILFLELDHTSGQVCFLHCVVCDWNSKVWSSQFEKYYQIEYFTNHFIYSQIIGNQLKTRIYFTAVFR